MSHGVSPGKDSHEGSSLKVEPFVRHMNIINSYGILILRVEASQERFSIGLGKFILSLSTFLVLTALYIGLQSLKSVVLSLSSSSTKSNGAIGFGRAKRLLFVSS